MQKKPSAVDVLAVLLSLSALGACKPNPCGQDAKPAKDGEISERFKEFGVPPGGTMCMMMSGDLDLSSINYAGTKPEEGDKKFAEFMASKGWDLLEKPPEVKKREFESALGGCLGDHQQVFGKKDSHVRYYSTSSHCWEVGNVTGIYKVECGKQGAQQEYCKDATAPGPASSK